MDAMTIPNSSGYDVAVIGAGVVGSAIARELSRYRIRVCLIEKEADVSFGTSKANSGIIHAGFHSNPGMLKTRLCVLGNREFDNLSEELEFPFQRRGELVVAFTPEDLRILQNLYRQGRENHVPYLELVGRDRALELEPALNPDVLGALYAPTAGILGPYEYCFALAENAVANGVELHLNEKVVWIARDDSGFRIRTERGGTFATRFVVNAAGLYADEIAAMVGITSFTIRPRKGEEYLLDKRVGELVKRIIFPVPTPTSKGMLIIPTVDGPVMVGPTAEEVENKEDFSTTTEGLKRVFEHAQKMIPAIRSRDIITSFVGIRPVATGEDFIIGPTDVPGFINAAGIQSPGLTASPAIAKHVVEVLLKAGLALTAKPEFNPRREAIPRTRTFIETGRFDELAALVEKDPLYGHLVCRCEHVTEAEVVEAVRRGHVTLDSIKFATRAGSGRCQAGFCTSRLLAILSRETGMPIEKITKKGDGSEIVLYQTVKGSEHETEAGQ